MPSGLDYTSAERTPDSRGERESSKVSDFGRARPYRAMTGTYAIPLTCMGVSYRDRWGEWWCVTEQEHPTEQPSRCLVFMSDRAARRVCSFPSDWHTLDPLGLEELSWNR